MDKFNRRPSRAKRRAGILLALGAFTLPTAAYALLFLFGPRIDIVAGLTGMGVLYVLAVLAGVFVAIVEAFRRYRQWLEKLGVQPIQGPGFTPLELAAFEAFTISSPDNAKAFLTFISQAEVVSRFNNGAGCLTCIRSDLPLSIRRASEVVCYFQLGELGAPAGCRFWTDQTGAIDVLEFFTGDVSSRNFDWATADFEPIASPGTLRPPLARPVSTVPDPSYDKVLHAESSG